MLYRLNKLGVNTIRVNKNNLGRIVTINKEEANLNRTSSVYDGVECRICGDYNAI